LACRLEHLTAEAQNFIVIVITIHILQRYKAVTSKSAKTKNFLLCLSAGKRASPSKKGQKNYQHAQLSHVES
jgi:hypothetical protein